MAGLSSERSTRVVNSSVQGRSRSAIAGVGVGDQDIDQSGITLLSGLPSSMMASSSASLNPDTGVAADADGTGELLLVGLAGSVGGRDGLEVTEELVPALLDAVR